MLESNADVRKQPISPEGFIALETFKYVNVI